MSVVQKIRSCFSRAEKLNSDHLCGTERSLQMKLTDYTLGKSDEGYVMQCVYECMYGKWK